MSTCKPENPNRCYIKGMKELKKFDTPDLEVSRFHYTLTEERIAQFPLEQRDASNLLVYRPGGITHHVFRELPEVLPPEATLVFNDTRVIPARLHFTTDGGKQIEVFLLSPLPGADGNVWECLVGNRRHFLPGMVLRADVDGGKSLLATWHDRDSNTVRFDVGGGGDFHSMLEQVGKIPLPPYIKREADASDRERYQTVFAANKGAVAAPTAALHFTDAVLDRLDAARIGKAFLTLHVGAGTFRPVTASTTSGHEMHREVFQLPLAAVVRLLASGQVVAVGTTALRLLESLPYIYEWVEKHGHTSIRIDQEMPYKSKASGYLRRDVLEGLRAYMEAHRLDHLQGETGIFILPGFPWKMTDGLVTNFHQPGSTLLMLIESWIGEGWKEVYTEALERGYRFLSYGDSSLLLRS
jgi:S-adenosylmethionine:tRNA ribosyltransferase-isomerase